MQNKLILMLKYPRPGAVKTRLVPAMGERRACQLYRGLVQRTLGELERFSARTEVEVEARIADAPNDGAAREWLGNGLCLRPQGEGDLGQRMERVVREAFSEGALSVVVIGADCPQLTSEHLASAFGALGHADAVLGPAADGGYYLIGMRKFVPELFRGIQWGGEQVLEQTLAVARELRVAFQLLDTLHDLDRLEDLPLWAQTAAAQASGRGRVSVIIPAYIAGDYIWSSLAATRRCADHAHQPSNHSCLPPGCFSVATRHMVSRTESAAQSKSRDGECRTANGRSAGCLKMTPRNSNKTFGIGRQPNGSHP